MLLSWTSLPVGQTNDFDRIEVESYAYVTLSRFGVGAERIPDFRTPNLGTLLGTRQLS